MEPLKFKPILKEIIWGGSRICELLNIENNKTIGENWTLSYRDTDMSVVDSGIYKNKTIKEVIESNKKGMLGEKFKDLTDFPLLVKIINANDNLSIQVHPDDYYAINSLGLPYGKTEMWYVIEAKENATLVAGLKEGITKSDFEKAIEEGTVMECLNFVPVKSGDIIDIPAGLVHAITRGLLIAEIQQNSDTTFRIYDYDRTDKEGNKRELHIKQSLEVIDFSGKLSTKLAQGTLVKRAEDVEITHYINNHYFSIDKYELNGELFDESLQDRFSILVFLKGTGKIEGKDYSINVNMGETVFIPAELGNYKVSGNLTYLKSSANN